MPTGQPTPPISAMALRHTLVSMLFALVIAEVAIQASNVLTVAGDRWGEIEIARLFESAPARDIWLLVAPMSHLLLVMILICMSWVGWSRSIYRSDTRDVTKIYSINFLLLLIELALVVLYFVLARSVELRHSSLTSQEDISALIPNPSGAPEALWLTTIYAGYFVWDFFADALPRYYPKSSRPFFEQIPILSGITVVISGVLVRCLISAVSAIAAFVVFRISSESSGDPLAAVCADMALMCIVFWFWLGKGWEPWLVQHVFTWERNREGTRGTEESSSSIQATLVLLPTYVLFLILI